MSDDNASNTSTIPDEDLWAMGAVTRRTGISEHTLRAWERRFDFPQPIRLPSGHRRYTNDQVQQLLLINRALNCGHRAGDVVPLPVARLEGLIRECDEAAATEQPRVAARAWVHEVIQDALAFDEAVIQAKIGSEAATLGVGRFLRERVVPLIDELGDAWERGEIGVRHEHFVSEILDTHLNSLRLPFEVQALGRPIVLACLPDEDHGLGLQMVALEIAAAGRKHLILGARTPVEEMVAAARSLDAAVLGVSVSTHADSKGVAEQIGSLRAQLPQRTELWVGGAGAPPGEQLPDGVRRFANLDDVSGAVRTLPD